jgi:hypothetical protein
VIRVPSLIEVFQIQLNTCFPVNNRIDFDVNNRPLMTLIDRRRYTFTLLLFITIQGGRGHSLGHVSSGGQGGPTPCVHMCDVGGKC